MKINSEKWILQLCHLSTHPFDYCCNQYASYFKDTEYKVLTVFFSNENNDISNIYNSDEFIFLNYSTSNIRLLMSEAAKIVKDIYSAKNIELCIIHSFVLLNITHSVINSPIMYISHMQDEFDTFQKNKLIKEIKTDLCVIGVCDFVTERIKDQTKMSIDNIYTIHNSIDSEYYSNKIIPRFNARQKLNLDNESFVIGNAARLHEDKDQKTLICAFSDALEFLPKNSKLVIAGSGYFYQNLYEYAVSLNVIDNIIFTGFVKDIRLYYNAFDMFILSSKREAYAFAVIEALSAGIPTIVSSNIGITNSIYEEFVFEQGNSNDLCQKIKYCYNNGNLKYFFKENNFSIESSMKEFINLPFIKKLNLKLGS